MFTVYIYKNLSSWYCLRLYDKDSFIEKVLTDNTKYAINNLKNKYGIKRIKQIKNEGEKNGTKRAFGKVRS